MVEIIMFAVIVVVVVCMLGAVIYHYTKPFKPSTVPGMAPTTQEKGNLEEISNAGSLHEFLMSLHAQYGSIASFWMGKRYVVSICSPELFKEHRNLFNRPPELFRMFEALFGPMSITYANDDDILKRRTNYDPVFTHQCVKRYYSVFQEVADELVSKWSDLEAEAHIPLTENMYLYVLKGSVLTLYGMSVDENEILEFKRHYDICWSEMERRLTEPVPESGSPRFKAFEEARNAMITFIQRTVQNRKKHPPLGEAETLLDALIEMSSCEQELLSDAVTFSAGSFHTTGNVLSWGIYFLVTHPEVQEKVYKEIKTVLGQGDVDSNNINDLPYLRQVIDETMRCAVVGPYAARFQDSESTFGGHKLPRGTPVIHALGVSMYNEKYWPMPNKFDPERFSPENSKSRPSLAFQPFGFAGKRICPGYRFAYSEVTVFLVTLLRKFEFKIVGGQVIKPVHGLVTHPNEEIWLTIEKR